MDAPGSIAGVLREEILALEHPSGEPLREVALASRFGASRRSVREALAILAHEGLVVREAHRGARVRGFEAPDVVDLYRVRRLLEAEGAAACAHASEAALARVSLAFARLAESARAARDSPRHAVDDMRFHGAVIALAGSARLDEIFDRLAVEMSYAIRLLQRDEAGARIPVDEVIEEHERILRAVLARDATAAVDEVRRHIDDNNARLQRLLAERDQVQASAP